MRYALVVGLSIDPVRDKPRSSSRGKIARLHRRTLGDQYGVCCRSMYCQDDLKRRTAAASVEVGL